MRNVCKHLKGAFMVGDETECQTCQIERLIKELSTTRDELKIAKAKLDGKEARLVSYDPACYRTCTLNIKGDEYYYTLTTEFEGVNYYHDECKNTCEELRADLEQLEHNSDLAKCHEEDLKAELKATKTELTKCQKALEIAEELLDDGAFSYYQRKCEALSGLEKDNV